MSLFEFEKLSKNVKKQGIKSGSLAANFQKEFLIFYVFSFKTKTFKTFKINNWFSLIKTSFNDFLIALFLKSNKCAFTFVIKRLNLIPFFLTIFDDFLKSRKDTFLYNFSNIEQN